MAFLDSILNYKRQEDEDYYTILGCDENSSVSPSTALGYNNEGDIIADNSGPYDARPLNLFPPASRPCSLKYDNQFLWVEQICTEYKVRALLLHPDKNPKDKGAEKRFQRLQLAKEVLTDPEQRRKYDTWLRSGLAVPFDHWLAKKDNMQMSMHWAVRTKKDLMLPPGEIDCSDAREAQPQPNPGSDDPPRGHFDLGPTVTDVQWFQGSASNWERDAAPKDVLKKFRNYEI